MALTSILNGTAQQIGEITAIPRTKTYDALNRLSDMNLIEKIEGKPLRYRAKSPVDRLSTIKERIMDDFNSTLLDLQNRWDNRSDVAKQSIQLIYGGGNMIDRTISMIDKAKNNILLSIRFLVDEEIELLIKSLRNIKKSGVSISILIFPELYNMLDKTIVDNLSEFASIHIAPVPVRILIVDSDDMLLTVPVFINNSIDQSLTQSVLFRNSSFVSMIKKSLNISESFMDKV